MHVGCVCVSQAARAMREFKHSTGRLDLSYIVRCSARMKPWYHHKFWSYPESISCVDYSRSTLVQSCFLFRHLGRLVREVLHIYPKLWLINIFLFLFWYQELNRKWVATYWRSSTSYRGAPTFLLKESNWSSTNLWLIKRSAVVSGPRQKKKIMTQKNIMRKTKWVLPLSSLPLTGYPALGLICFEFLSTGENIACVKCR